MDDDLRRQVEVRAAVAIGKGIAKLGSGIAWAGFWIALGAILVAGVVTGQVRF